MFNKKLNKLVYVAMLVTIHLDLSFLLFLLTKVIIINYMILHFYLFQNPIITISTVIKAFIINKMQLTPDVASAREY